jgi:hypothetical protein
MYNVKFPKENSEDPLCQDGNSNLLFLTTSASPLLLPFNSESEGSLWMF